MLRGLEHLCDEETQRAGAVEWRREAERDVINGSISQGGCQRMDQTLFSGAQRQGEGQRAQTETQEAPCEHEQKLVCWEVPEPGPGCPERVWSLLL